MSYQERKCVRGKRVTTDALDGWSGETTSEWSQGTSPEGAWEGGLLAAGMASAKALGWGVPDKLQEQQGG